MAFQLHSGAEYPNREDSECPECAEGMERVEVSAGLDGNPLGITICAYWCERCHIGVVPYGEPAVIVD